MNDWHQNKQASNKQKKSTALWRASQVTSYLEVPGLFLGSGYHNTMSEDHCYWLTYKKNSTDS